MRAREFKPIKRLLNVSSEAPDPYHQTDFRKLQLTLASYAAGLSDAEPILRDCPPMSTRCNETPALSHAFVWRNASSASPKSRSSLETSGVTSRGRSRSAGHAAP